MLESFDLADIQEKRTDQVQYLQNFVKHKCGRVSPQRDSEVPTLCNFILFPVSNENNNNIKYYNFVPN